ncbi:hypothetical protein RHGRI_024408 [Rhododendron griersonianum]|uniref:PB1 domain-containing protein n=1 Tax=Rhododendron griersonianum TaxID=479676 RepID=A0AAV6JBD1_9ERIC|nr:hypothetical protein RHGRI_024408 [Rhododendron griersonianum]
MTPISVNSNDDNNANSNQKIKFLYSYGGKILPRPTDGKLLYAGGLTRVLSVDRSITFAELMVRFLELCGSLMTLKCKLPTEDLDVLVTITCDEELVNLIEEYSRFLLSTNKDLKITAVLFPLKSLQKISPPPSPASSLDFSSAIHPPPVTGFWCRNSWPAFGFRFPAGVRKDGGKVRY